MRTVLVANRKGGVGKTLISVTLASALANRGQRVGLADADRQMSSLRWLERRPATVPQIRGLDWTQDSRNRHYPKRLDWLIIDAPGALKGAKAEALISEAKAVLAPVQPSFFDENATRGFLTDIEEIKRVRKGKVGIHIIANRTRPNARAAIGLTNFLEEIGMAPLAWISDRAIYGEYAAQGLAIYDRPLKSLIPVKQQWATILDTLGA